MSHFPEASKDISKKRLIDLYAFEAYTIFTISECATNESQTPIKVNHKIVSQKEATNNKQDKSPLNEFTLFSNCS